MDYSFFTVNRWTFDDTNWQIWNAASVGMESGSNPISGSAMWTGAMVGRTHGAGEHEPGVLVTGESSLTFDFVRNDLDVALTGIRSTNGQTYADLTWENIQVENGHFGGSVQGSFYGPNHEEVSGTFERQNMLGAFGATR
ncbi:MAG: transferrin-binding protein-like solute binding protein [Nitrospira sp.]|nr:transferrin-binding protein-like solute binding protein [Nitrospira sp.]